jgi:hypothetical protein
VSVTLPVASPPYQTSRPRTSEAPTVPAGKAPIRLRLIALTKAWAHPAALSAARTAHTICARASTTAIRFPPEGLRSMAVLPFAVTAKKADTAVAARQANGNFHLTGTATADPASALSPG